MPTDGTQWTRQQALAIDTIDREVLVTASAGTGKTAVLSQRCAKLLAGIADPTDVSQIVVLTFTEAAAEEMRSRIAGALSRQYERLGGDHLRRQILSLDAAHIGTIHAFCKRTIDEFFYELPIDPTYRIIEADQQKLLKTDALIETVDRAWQDAAIAPAMEKLLSGRGIRGQTDGVLGRIVGLSGFLDGLAGRNQWYQRADAIAEMSAAGAADAAGMSGAFLMDKLLGCEQRIEHALLLDRKLGGVGFWDELIREKLLRPVENCIELLQRDDIAGAMNSIRQMESFRFNPYKGIPKETAALIKAPADDARKILKNLASLAIANPDYERLVAPSASLQTKVIIELVKRFDDNYSRAKKRLNCLDFADLEHLALELLDKNESIAARLADRFRYIFVDEYQDINAVQKAIIDRIRRKDNLFVVGDVKQSIYAFRQSRPEIFLEQLRGAAETIESGSVESGNTALRVDLSDNFRSRKEILDFVNAVFSRVMSAGIASVDYDQRAFLKAVMDYEPLEDTTGKDTAGKGARPVEIYILNEEQADEEDERNEQNETTPSVEDDLRGVISSSQRQAWLIAQRIRQMVGADTGRAQFTVYDKHTGTYRDVTYGDIVILMRSLAKKANQYVEVLRGASVPVNSQSCAGYFAATEVVDVISLLKVLDNPRRDIELAAVLRSAMFKVTDAQLAMIRSNNPVGSDHDTATAGDTVVADFYECAAEYAQSGPDGRLRQRLAGIFTQLNQWRRRARRGGLAELLWDVYRGSGYLSFVTALPGGSQRRANLLKLHDRAIQFEGFAGQSAATSLGRFVEFVEKLLEEGQDWAPAEPGTSSQNAVRIMSIHKSKGLEFPVVFLAEMNGQFNRKDTFGPCLIDRTNALGIQVVQPESGAIINTVSHEIIAEKQLATMLAEEMRILYVAMTRARERLVLYASKKQTQCRKLLADCGTDTDGQIPTWRLKGARCHFDWVMQALANRRELLDLFGIDDITETSNDNSDNIDDGPDNLFTARLIGSTELDDISRQVLASGRSRTGRLQIGTGTGPAGKMLLAKVTAAIERRYRYQSAANMPAKQSVSELSHRDDEFALVDLDGVFARRPRVLTRTSTKEPAGPPARPSARQVGSATHLVIESLDLSAPVTTEAVGDCVAGLVSQGRIAAELSSLIDCDAVRGFFETEPGSKAIAHADKVRREWPFTMALDTGRFDARTGTGAVDNDAVDADDADDAVAPGDFMVVQGIVDMIVETEDDLIVIDFKTDHIRAEEAAERAELYRDQMDYYRRAVEAIMKKSVTGCMLYFLTPGVLIDFDGL